MKGVATCQSGVNIQVGLLLSLNFPTIFSHSCVFTAQREGSLHGGESWKIRSSPIVRVAKRPLMLSYSSGTQKMSLKDLLFMTIIHS